MPNSENPLAPWNPFAPVEWLLNQLYWLAGRVAIWLGHVLVWLLSCVPPGLGYLGYIIFAIWLTRWVENFIPMIPLNPDSPLFRQPGGARLWMRLGLFSLVWVIGAAGLGAYIPNELATTVWRNPFAQDADTLGPIGRIAELVGLVCGIKIGWHCQYQLNLLMLIGLIGWGLLSVAQFVCGS
jgi:hypothetical protein